MHFQSTYLGCLNHGKHCGKRMRKLDVATKLQSLKVDQILKIEKYYWITGVNWHQHCFLFE